MRISRRIGLILLTAVLLAGLTGYGVHAVSPCDESLVRGDRTEFTYVSNVIRCKNGKQILRGWNLYGQLDCDAAQGWIDVANSNAVVVNDPAEAIYIVCDTTLSNVLCDRKLINRFDDTKMKYDANKVLSCVEPDYELEYKDNLMRYAQLKCITVQGWMDEAGLPTGIQANKRIDVDCRLKACVEPLPIGFDAQKMKYASKVLSCKQSNYELDYNGGRYAQLTCDPLTGWMDGVTEVLKPATTEATFECRLKACDTELIVGFGVPKMKQIDASTIQCTASKERLRINDGAFAGKKLTCTTDGNWMIDDVDTTVASTDTIKAECYDTSCSPGHIKGAGMKYEAKQLRCEQSNYELEYNGVRYTQLKCDPVQGWMNDGAVVENAPTDQDVDFKCQLQACDQALASEFAILEMKYVNNVLSCTKTNYELEYNSNRYAQLTCDKSTGWMDGVTEVLKPATAEATFNCLVKACDTELIDGFDSTMRKIDDSTVACKAANQRLSIADEQFDGKQLTCAPEGNWMVGIQDTGVAAIAKISADCYAKACDPDNIQGDKLNANALNGLAIFTCSPDEFVQIGEKLAESIECDTEKGWTMNENKVAGSMKVITVGCVAKACHRSLRIITTDVKKDQGVFKCKETDKKIWVEDLSAPGIQSATSLTVSCDKQKGWLDKDGNKLLAADLNVKIKCLWRYCEKAMLTLNDDVQYTEKVDGASMICKDSKKVLYVQSKKMIFDKLECKSNKNWKEGTRLIERLRKFEVVCQEKACNRLLLNRLDETQISTKIDKKLTCIDTTKELRMKGLPEYRAEELTCDALSGWTYLYEDGFNNLPVQVAQADQNIALDCVRKACRSSLLDVPEDRRQLISFYRVDNLLHARCTSDSADKILDVGGRFYAYLLCTVGGKWTAREKTSDTLEEIKLDATDKFSIDCVENSCHKRWAALGAEVRRVGNTLTCAAGLNLNIKGTEIFTPTLICDRNKGWIKPGDDTQIKKSTEPVAIDCIGELCDARNIVQNDDLKILTSSPKILHLHAVCKNELETLYVNKVFYKSVLCDKSNGWIGITMEDSVTGILVKAREKITIECKRERCDTAYIDGDDGKLLFEYLEKKSPPAPTYEEELAREKERKSKRFLSCKNRDYRLRFNGVYQSDVMVCDLEQNVWEANGIAGNARVKVDCIDPCKFDAKPSNEHIKVVHKSDTRMISCNEYKSKFGGIVYTVPRLLKYKDMKYTSLQCDLVGGWKGLEMASHDLIAVECEDYCKFEYYGEADDFTSKMVDDKLYITPKQPDLALAPTSQADPTKAALVITCSYEEGWRADGQRIDNSDTQITMELGSHEMCNLAASDAEVVPIVKNLEIYCVIGRTLAVNKVLSFPLKCGPRHWFSPEFPSDTIYHHDWAIPLNAECLETPSACARGDNAPVLPAEVVPPTGNNFGVYECKEKDVENPKNAIKLNGAFIHSHLECDPMRGWTDMDGKVLAQPNDFVNIECGDSKCSIVTPKCDSSLKFPEGYKCVIHDFNTLKDPNLRICGEKQKIRFGLKTITDRLRCSDDGSWHEIGNYTNILKPDEAVSCIQMICNECAEPALLTTPIVNPPSKPTFTPGTADKCAKAECPNDLWSVEMSDGKVKEYGGKVVCSPETGTGVWKLDNKDQLIVKKVGCIKEVTSCEVAFELETKCDQPYEVIPLDSMDKIKCTKDKKLFYKANGAEYFEEDGKYLQCDKKKGWVLQSKSNYTTLNKGYIVCAEKNPNPRTTTTKIVSTTVAPFIKACDLCPTIASMLQQCDFCSDKAKDVDLLSSPTFDKCYAKSISNGSFQTEKLGTIAGPLECDNENLVWMYNGVQVGKFAAAIKKPEVEQKAATVTIVICSLIGVVTAIVAGVLIYKWFIPKRGNAENSDDAKNEEKKRLEKLQENELDYVAVDLAAK